MDEYYGMQQQWPLAAEARRIFALQQISRPRVAHSSAADRVAKLDRLRAAIESHREALREAMWLDFRKPAAEVELLEIQPTLLELNHVRAKLATWMRPDAVATPWVLMRTRSEVHYQPRGVVLIMAPWNYPFGLVLTPLIAAVAAGNCVIVRPSEKVPRTGEVITRIIRQAFDEQEVACFTEHGTELAAMLLTFPFDHMFFTGSAGVGRMVMQAAAEHLASVTLELGGKSPLIVDETADVRRAADRAVWGKCVNAGQTCIAPDYAVVHESVLDSFVDAAKRTIERFYGSTEEARQASPHFPRAIDDRAVARLQSLIGDAVTAGARVEIGGRIDPKERYVAPTVLTGIGWDSPAMREEIFGPVLPVLTFESLDDVLENVRRRSQPLTVYLFSRSQQNIERVLQRTSSGGVVINTVVVHYANPHLPFGGVGGSGQGTYHGWYGFREFSHERAVLRQKGGGATSLLNPPYGRKTGWLLKLLERVIG